MKHLAHNFASIFVSVFIRWSLCLLIAKILFPGKKEVEDYLQQLSAAKKYAESIAAITPELEKEFLEVFSISN